jgi:NitT/TauT family transport system ATP-binding protein
MTGVHVHIKNKTYKNAVLPTILDFELVLDEHEFVCLIGQSGCGKTTLLNCIAGLDTHYSGKICIDHQNEKPPKIGYVFQQSSLLPWRTVRENIELVFTDKTDIPQQQIDDLLNFMQLTDFQDAYPKQLSEGMRRRVSIIRAFALNPDLLLMDEPFISLDAPMARDIRERLQQLWQNRPHTILFVTHDLREAIALADRLIFLTTRPMRVLREVAIPDTSKQSHDTQWIDTFCVELIQHYPELQPLL